jgi:hypothetical protein
VGAGDLRLEVARAEEICALPELRRWLRDPELLAVDDIERCGGCDSVQRELIENLDGRLEQGQLTVVAGSAPPAELKGFRPALLSRLGSGVVLALKMASRAERVQVLSRLVEGERLTRDVMEYLAARVTDDLRQLGAAARQLVVMSERASVPVDLDLARAVIPLPGDLHPSNRGASELQDASRDEDEDEDEDDTQPAGDDGERFKAMLQAAESAEEQALALQIALGESLRRAQSSGARGDVINKLERALELLRDGNIEEAMQCIDHRYHR